KSIPSQLSLPALVPAIWRNFTLKKEGQTLKSYYSKLVGKRNYERVLSKAFGAVISQPADDYPADLLFNKRERRKDILRKFTFPGGLQTITDTMAAEKNLELIASCAVRDIDAQGGRISVDTDKGSHLCDRLAVATPASVAAGLLKTAWPELADKLARIKVNKAETVGVAVEKEAVSIERFANLIPQDDLFFSVVSRDIVPDPTFRGFTFHFKPGVAGPEAKLKRIGEVLKVDPDELTRVVTKDNFVPALKVGHERLIGEIDAFCAGKNLFLTGNYFSGMAVEDCVCRSLAEFNRLAPDVR
ncbi:MAG: amine oxidase, partial [Actinomycetota bacterium]|nr:amine oxidase [Actinomycetota bacterium]